MILSEYLKSHSKAIYKKLPKDYSYNKDYSHKNDHSHKNSFCVMVYTNNESAFELYHLEDYYVSSCCGLFYILVPKENKLKLSV